MDVNANMLVEVNRGQPEPMSDHVTGIMRGTRYREMYTQSMVLKQHCMADEGSYFIATNPTPGTGIAMAVNATVSETAGNVLNIFNADDPNNTPNGKRIYLDYIKLICTVAPASATALQGFHKVDRYSRYTSGGSLIAPVNVNMDAAASGIAGNNAIINFGALVTTAPTQAARLVGRNAIRSAIPVVGDVYIFSFGDIERNISGVTPGVATAMGRTMPCVPIIIGAQQNYSLQIWAPGNAVTPASFEFEIGYWVR